MIKFYLIITWLHFFQRFPMRISSSHPSISAAVEVTTEPESRLGLATLEPSIRHYFQHRLASPIHSKNIQYSDEMFLYILYNLYNVINPFPLTEHLLCSLAAYLADQNLAPQTIKSYLSALHKICSGWDQLLKGSPPRISTAHIFRAKIHASWTGYFFQPWEARYIFGPSLTQLSLAFSAWVNCYRSP